MNEFDPVQYGKLLQAVEQMESEMKDIRKDLKELVELANKSKGGFWVTLGVASFIGAIFSYILRDFFTK